MMCTKCAVSNSMKSVVVQRPTSNAGNRIKGGQDSNYVLGASGDTLYTDVSKAVVLSG